jgi:hypothetical protein
MESCLVSTNELKNLTSIGQNIDCELLTPHLLIAQQLYLEPVLGCALYNDIIYRFDNNQLTGNTQVLYEQYIVPAIAYASWYSLSPFLNWRTSRNGINKSGTDTLQPIEIQEFSMYSSKVENLMRFYLKRLEDYLKCNKDLFPLYCQNASEISPGGNVFTGWNSNPKRGRFWDSGFDSLFGDGNCGNCNPCDC